MKRDADGNASPRDSIAQTAAGNYVDAGGKLVALLGVQDLVVVDTPDALLIADRRRAQEVGDDREGTGTAQAGRPAVETQQKRASITGGPLRLAACCDYLLILRLITADLRLSKELSVFEPLEAPWWSAFNS